MSMNSAAIGAPTSRARASNSSAVAGAPPTDRRRMRVSVRSDICGRLGGPEAYAGLRLHQPPALAEERRRTGREAAARRPVGAGDGLLPPRRGEMPRFLDLLHHRFEHFVDEVHRVEGAVDGVVVDAAGEVLVLVADDIPPHRLVRPPHPALALERLI